MSIFGASSKASLDKVDQRNARRPSWWSPTRPGSRSRRPSPRRSGTVDGVETVRAVPDQADGEDRRRRQQFASAQPTRTSWRQALNYPIDAGTVDAVRRPTAILVDANVAESKDLKVGDDGHARVPGPQADKTHGRGPVRGQLDAGARTSSRLDTLEQGRTSSRRTRYLFITLSPGASESTVRADIDKILGRRPTVDAEEPAGVRRRAARPGRTSSCTSSTRCLAWRSSSRSSASSTRWRCR